MVERMQKNITSMPRKEAGQGVFHRINFEICPPLDITRNLGGKHNHQFQPFQSDVLKNLP